MALYFKEPEMMNNLVAPGTAAAAAVVALDLALPKPQLESRISPVVIPPPLHHPMPHQIYSHINLSICKVRLYIHFSRNLHLSGYKEQNFKSCYNL